LRSNSPLEAYGMPYPGIPEGASLTHTIG
jgi:hypothetical protein